MVLRLKTSAAHIHNRMQARVQRHQHTQSIKASSPLGGFIMAPGDDVVVAGGGSNSSDFVRKLYRMLEEPSYANVVRWGDDGTSFVVLENEKFTKHILPKHFKHSNFASFVRQLNKYDFHKVRQNEENGTSPYGAQAWEFRHPEFTKHSKHNLDNIRRKAPAPRKTQPVEDPFAATQQLALMSESLTATQHQVQGLQEHLGTLVHQNKVMVEEIHGLRRRVKVVTQVNGELLQHLSKLDERRRDSRHSAHSNHSGQSANFQNGNLGVLPDGNDEPSAELRRARELLGAIEPEAPADQAFHRLSVAYQTQTNSPPDSAASSVLFSQPSSAIIPQSIVQNPFSEDPRFMVYPAGPNVGIDPFHPDHANNLPMALPQVAHPDPATQMTVPVKGKEDDLWGPRKPRVFLVEDDKTCSRVGSKFLSQIGCCVETAKDGDEATNKVNSDAERFDLIFMDIIMPNCDGVSATIYIRGVNQRVPIIAMTSNIRQDEIASYYQWGMNDILAKPFTKDGMAKILMKFCSHLLKNPGAAAELEPSGQAMMGSGAIATPTYAGAIPPSVSNKFETTPINSPATSGSWHSPNQSLTHASPNLDGGYMQAAGITVSNPQMVMNPGGLQGGVFAPQIPHMPQMANPSMPRMQGGMGDHERPEKRQRLYAPPGQAPQGGPVYRQ